MWSIATVLIVATAASASVVQQRPERRAADPAFLLNQKRVMELYVGLGHNNHLDVKLSQYDLNANLASFTDEKYPKALLEVLHKGILSQNSIFSLANYRTKMDVHKLFDVFFFAKDFDSFMKVAGWARATLNPGMFAYAYTLALTHRSDTQSYIIPPLYEIFPNLFTPSETLHQIFDAKMAGIKEGRFTYNNTGYEYDFENMMFDSLLSHNNKGYGDFRVSYFREDVGLNNYLANYLIRNPRFMCTEKYNTPWLKRRGENFLQVLQQLFARYTHERVANGLPNVELLQWREPIKVGYSPRLTYLNGRSLYNRPDNIIPEQYSPSKVLKAQSFERRVWDLVEANGYIDLANGSLTKLNVENGAEILGRVIHGTVDAPNRRYFRSLFYNGLEALAFITTSASDRTYIGNALGDSMTLARDPVFYSFIERIIKIKEWYKRMQPWYKEEDVMFNGVKVQNVEVDKLLTYFDMFEYEVTSSVPMSQREDFKNHRYLARQYRLNHKPYNFKINVNSEKAADGIVRIYLGLKQNTDQIQLTSDLARMTFVEIDRFQVKLDAGENIIERNSKESPIFISDPEGYRSLYNDINNAISLKAPFYITEYGRCGLPERLQLPMGWKGGRSAQLAVIVSPFDSSQAAKGNSQYDIACGGEALNDGRAKGFPFDRPHHKHSLNVPNIFYKEVQIYHKEQSELNRPAPQ